MATSQVLSSAAKYLQGESKDGDKGEAIEPKDFFWDQFLKYISSGILALTVLNVSVEFLRGGGVTCFTPAARVELTTPEQEEYDLTRNQAEYINNYCARSIPSTEYFPVYILVHGILLIAPHYVWSALFKGDFDSFFSIVKKLDRLRDSMTGEYNLKNFDRVTKLETEYGGKRRWIFWSYIFKLVLQLAVCIGSIVFSAAYFIDFSFSFQCPEDFSIENGTIIYPDNWPINATVPCVFTSLRLLGIVRYGDHMLLTLAMGITIYGLLWCFRRHIKELGFQAIANFAFKSCLSPDSFVFPQAIMWKYLFPCFSRFACRRRNCCCQKNCLKCRFFTESHLFSPRIQNDLEFMLMVLFGSDSSHGRVFKDIQVSKELKKQKDRDHQLLHLYINVQQEMRRRGVQAMNGEPIDEAGGQPRLNDLRDFFRDAGFSVNPEQKAHEFYRPYLGNTEWHDVSGIRDILYGFVQFCPKDQSLHPTTELAVDISFGSTSIGYSLVLARAFKAVVSVDFHPYYRNEKQVVRTMKYFTNYVTATCPESVFAQSYQSINEINSQILDELINQTRRKGIHIDFIVVGPIGKESEKVTVNLLIDMMFVAKQIGEGAILLAIRPLKVAHKVVKKRFYEYKPAKELFDHDYHRGAVHGKLQREIGFDYVGEIPGVRVTCDNVPCIFEFVAYKFIGRYSPQEEAASCDQDEEQSGTGSGDTVLPTGRDSASSTIPQTEADLDPEDLKLLERMKALPAPPDPTRSARALPDPHPDQSESSASATTGATLLALSPVPPITSAASQALQSQKQTTLAQSRSLQNSRDKNGRSLQHLSQEGALAQGPPNNEVTLLQLQSLEAGEGVSRPRTSRLTRPVNVVAMPSDPSTASATTATPHPSRISTFSPAQTNASARDSLLHLDSDLSDLIDRYPIVGSRSSLAEQPLQQTVPNGATPTSNGVCPSTTTLSDTERKTTDV